MHVPLTGDASMNNLTSFNENGLEIYIDTKTGESFASRRAMARMVNRHPTTISNWLKKEGIYESEEDLVEVQTTGGLQRVYLISEPFVFKCALKYKPALAEQLGQAGTRVFLHHLAGYKVTSNAIEPETIEVKAEKIESDRRSLELKLAPKPTLEEIDMAATMFGKRFGKAYEQRYLTQQVKKAYPRLTGEAPRKNEVASLPTAQALLTPTQIASELHWYCSTGNPDARKVNLILEHLGYQVKIAGSWSATEKAINANLCDRKPVETNSRTQKDQLMWSAKIVDILKEHAIID